MNEPDRNFAQEIIAEIEAALRVERTHRAVRAAVIGTANFALVAAIIFAHNLAAGICTAIGAALYGIAMIYLAPAALPDGAELVDDMFRIIKMLHDDEPDEF